MTLEPGQVLKKLYECKRCHRMIRLEVREIKADGKAAWNQLEEDGQTAHPHDCNKNTTAAGTTTAAPTLDSADTRAILESLQLISRKLDAVLANSGTKTPK